jgi:hypothetical protein
MGLWQTGGYKGQSDILRQLRDVVEEAKTEGDT